MAKRWSIDHTSTPLDSANAVADGSASIPVYVISLPDAAIRRRNMVARFSAAGMAFRFVDAVDGRTVPVADTFDGARIVRQPFGYESEIACTVSHRLVHRMIANGDADTALVLEDDAELAEDFPEVVQRALSFRFDIFKLEGFNLAYRRVTIGRIGQYNVIVTILPSQGAAAYLIRREAARRICSLDVIDQVADLVFADPRLRLRVLEIEPFCARQDNETASTLKSLPIASYAPPERRRAEWLSQSTRRKLAIARAHGPLVLLRLELRRIRPWTNRAWAIKSGAFILAAICLIVGWWLYR
jgi:GR25 family glycosyltransferase involved in LPS biosynthesis